MMSGPSTVGSSAAIDDVEAYLDEKLAFFREEGVRPPSAEHRRMHACEPIAKFALQRAHVAHAALLVQLRRCSTQLSRVACLPSSATA